MGKRPGHLRRLVQVPCLSHARSALKGNVRGRGSFQGKMSSLRLAAFALAFGLACAPTVGPNPSDVPSGSPAEVAHDLVISNQTTLAVSVA